jgi:uncharacterized membrane protein
MEINKIIKLSLIILLLDSIYLNTTKSIFNKLVKKIQGENLVLNMKGAIMSYSLIIFSLYYFIIRENKKPLDAFLLGLSIYGIFDATNIAIFKKYDSYIAYVDTIWGGILYALTTSLYNII